MTDTRIRYAPLDTVRHEDLGDMIAVVEYEDGSTKTVGIDSFEEGGHMIQAAMAWDSRIVQGYTAQRAPAPAPAPAPVDFSFMGDTPEEWTPLGRRDNLTSLDL